MEKLFSLTENRQKGYLGLLRDETGGLARRHTRWETGDLEERVIERREREGILWEKEQTEETQLRG